MFVRSCNISKSNSFFLFGARGTGKTTYLNQQFNQENSFIIDLLESENLAQLQSRPDSLIDLVKRANKQWCIIDEVQKVPPLLDIVHLLIEKNKQKFALTGSSARKLKGGAANMLAGRAFLFHMFPLTHTEIGEDFDLESILSFGSLPKIFDLPEARDKKLYLKSYAETYLKEEILIEQLIRKLPPFRKFLEISAHQDSEIVSYSNIARDILVDPKIVTNYYSILEDTLLGFKLEPYESSLRKRQKKAPKFYWFDLGVRRVLSGTIDSIVTPQSFEYGSLFESFIVNEIFRLLTYSETSFKLSYIRLDDNLEVDVIIERAGQPTYLIEIKSSDRISETHVKSLKKVSSLINKSIPILISRDKIEKKIDGVSCIYWKNVFKEIGLS
jgi:predicted AAA+ superfamily ATPase